MNVVEPHPPIVESLLCPNESATQVLATRLAHSPAVRDAFIELQGELGAGKTTLVRHLLRALGVQGRIKSPTYAVVEVYDVGHDQPAPSLNTPFNIWHFDFYRFQDPQEWEDAGFRDIFTRPGLKLAEWPDKAGALLPRADLTIQLTALANDARQLTLSAHSPIGEALVQSLQGLTHSEDRA